MQWVICNDLSFVFLFEVRFPVFVSLIVTSRHYFYASRLQKNRDLISAYLCLPFVNGIWIHQLGRRREKKQPGKRDKNNRHEKKKKTKCCPKRKVERKISNGMLCHCLVTYEGEQEFLFLYFLLLLLVCHLRLSQRVDETVVGWLNHFLSKHFTRQALTLIGKPKGLSTYT